MEEKEKFLGEKLVDENGEEVEWGGTNGGGLAEKYARMMENADESWIELFRKEIFSQKGFVDPFHILCYGISADFVVSANMYITMGMTFEYGNAKRYNFSLMLFHRKSTSETIDLEESHYQFDFYVMGTMGVRAGIEFEVGIGLFSLALDSIGITAEAGAYAQLWGYFYYHLSWSQSEGKSSNGMGAMVIEVGAYLTVTFKAQLFSSEKLTYQPTLLDKQWPIFTVGSVENVIDFAYPEDDESLTYKIIRTKTFTLPDSIFDMAYMDMKTGEICDGTDNPAKNFDDATESNFEISFTDSSFSYDPATNTVTITPKNNLNSAYSEMNIVWKNSALAFTSRPIKRTVRIFWDNPPSGNLISFEVNGGTFVDMIFAKPGASISRPQDPFKIGYTFGGWYTDKELQTPYVFPNTMPKVDTVVYAKWIPATNIKYTVEHYHQNLNNEAQYTLADSETFLNGVADSKIYPAVKSYEGFTSPATQELLILPNGGAILKYFYSRNSYKLTFDRGEFAGESDENAELTLKYGESIFVPILAMAGYTFLGYDREVPDTMPGHDLKFNARWQANPNTPYRVESYIQNITDDEYSLGNIETLSGTTGSLLEISDLSKVNGNGLKFTKATVDGTEVTSVAISGDGKLVIKLYYNRNSFNAVYHVENGTTKTDLYRYGALISEPEVPARAGYTFSGWFADAGLSQLYSFGNAMPDRDVDIYGKLIPNTNTPYTVNHYVENLTGTYVLTQTDRLTGTTDTSITLENLKSDKIIVANGITYKEAKVGGAVQTTATILGDGSLAVNLYYSRNSHTLTFDANNAKATGGTSSTVKYGASINAPTVMLAGYTFEGWYDNAACTGEAVTIPNAMPAGDLIVYAKWTANTNTPYKVEHYQQNANNDGYTKFETEELTGTTDTTAEAQAKTYEGFYINTDVLDTVQSGTIEADGSLTLKLYYDREKYTITFDANEGTLSGDDTQTLKHGETVFALDPTRTGYGFDGWYLDVEGTRLFNNIMPMNNITVYAKWTAGSVNYRVEHYLMGMDGEYPETASFSETKSGISDTTLTLETLRNNSYEVEGGIVYNHAKVDGVEATTANVAPDSSLVVKLYYERKLYTLAWNLAGATAEGGTAEGYVYYGTPLTAPTLNKIGHNFAGWEPSVPSTMPAKSISFTAKWTPITYEITYRDKDGASFSGTHNNPPMTYTYGTEVTLTTPTKAHHSFDGWYADPSCTGLPVTKITATDIGNKTFYAKWTPDSYTITYVLNGGTNDDSNPASYTYGEGVAALLPPTKAGYDFGGWHTDEALTDAISSPVISTTDTGDKVFYAKWTAKSYTITYSNLYGATHTNPLTYTIESEFTLLPPSDRTGYTFVGWYNAQNGGSQVTQITKGGMGDITVYARWQANTYNISYVLNGGTNASNPASYTYGQGVAALFPPTRTGYNFGGWYTDEALTQAAPNPVISIYDTGDKVFYAKWILINYNLTFENLNGATHSNPSSYSIISDDITLSAPTERVGYTFVGWYTDITAGYKVTSITKGSTGDKTLYARWTADTYTITYNLAGGSQPNPPNPTSYTIESSTFTLRAPTFAGYIFTGWTGSNGSTPQMTVEIPKGSVVNKTYTANWTPATWTVTYDMDGGTFDSSLPTSYPLDGSLKVKSPAASSQPNPLAKFLYWRDIYTGEIVTTLSGKDYHLRAYWLDGSESNPYKISSENDLITLRTLASQDAAFLSKYYRVSTQFTLRDWNEPIGSASKPFVGQFDGGDYTITHLRATAPLFHTVGTSTANTTVFIKSVKMNADTTVEGTPYFGFIAERLNSGVIENCNLQLNVVFNNCTNVGGIVATSAGKLLNCQIGGYIQVGGKTDTIGGIVGFLDRGQVQGCTSNTNISSSGASGSGTITSAGGIVGKSIGSTIHGCINNGMINFNGHYRGGIVGETAQVPTVITWCQNAGRIYDSMYAVSYTGGIVGFVNKIASLGMKIENCVNTGIIDSYSGAGIAGRIETEIGCTINIVNCVNNVRNPSNNWYAAIVGFSQGYVNVSKCYSDNTVIKIVRDVLGSVSPYITNCGTFQSTVALPVTAVSGQTLAYPGKNLVDALNQYAIDNNVKSYTWYYVSYYSVVSFY